jgi:hypothetical protein
MTSGRLNDSMSIPRTRRRCEAMGLAALALAGAAFSVAASWPGQLSNDSLVQYQAARAGVYTDWHPPFMAWVWRQLLRVLPGPQGMLLLQQGLLWGGLWLFARAARPQRWAPLLLLAGVAPWVMNFSGAIWKDCAMAFALLLAAGLMLPLGDAAEDAVGNEAGDDVGGGEGGADRRIGPWRAACALLLLFVALNLRHNAVLAIAPLLAWWLRRVWPAARWWQVVAAAAAVLALLLMVARGVQYGLLAAERQRPGNVALVDDLAHLSLRAGRSLIPGVSMRQVQWCAGREIGGSKLLNRHACLSALGPRDAAPAVRADLTDAWRSAVAAHPAAYVRFRLAAFASLLRSPELPPAYARHGVTVPNDAGWSYHPNGAGRLALAWVDGAIAALPALFKPFTWLAAGIALLVISLRHPHRPGVLPERVLLVSALAYTLGYVPVTPLTDLRYTYWSALATTLAAGWMLLRSRAVAAAAPGLMRRAGRWRSLATAGPRPRRGGRDLLPAGSETTPATFEPRPPAWRGWRLLAAAGLLAMAGAVSMSRWAVVDADGLLRAGLGTGTAVPWTALRDLAPAAGGGWRMTGAAPRLVADRLPGDAADFLSFELQCAGSGALPLGVRGRARGAGALDEEHVIDFEAAPGTNVIALPTYPPWPAGARLTGLQMELPAAPALCRSLEVHDVRLHP